MPNLGLFFVLATFFLPSVFAGLHVFFPPLTSKHQDLKKFSAGKPRLCWILDFLPKYKKKRLTSKLKNGNRFLKTTVFYNYYKKSGLHRGENRLILVQIGKNGAQHRPLRPVNDLDFTPSHFVAS